jgi:hypothetical protein
LARHRTGFIFRMTVSNRTLSRTIFDNGVL